jgi:hypothetical protein
MRPLGAQGAPWENPQDRGKNCENYSENEKSCHGLAFFIRQSDQGILIAPD